MTRKSTNVKHTNKMVREKINKVKNSKDVSIEIMDTTLRDGEQTHNVSFSPTEKLHIARILLEKVNVSRIEVASARVSQGEHEAVSRILQWASSEKEDYDKRIEVLGFVDDKKSIDWITSAGGQVINLLTKGSLKHLQHQLRKTPQEHFKDIEKVRNYAAKKMSRLMFILKTGRTAIKILATMCITCLMF